MTSNRELLRRVTTRRVCEFHIGNNSHENAAMWLRKQWQTDYIAYKNNGGKLTFRFESRIYPVRTFSGSKIVARGKIDDD